MSSIAQFFSGSGGGGVPCQLLKTTSGTFTCPVRAKYLITAIGGGAGSGDGVIRGGGAGGLAQSLVSLNAGTVLTYVIGAGGNGPTNAGGNTTVTGTGISLTANGGQGGTAGGVGGTASGGNIMNIQGGTGGAGSTFGGGGAVGVYGYVCDASNGGTGGQGAGTGGGGGFASVPGPALNVPFSIYLGTFDGIYVSTSQQFLQDRLLQPTGFEQARSSVNAPGVGSNNNTIQAGLFAGGGGQTPNAAPGLGGFLGGGGGGTSAASPSYTSIGGQGGVIIEYFLS